MREHEVQEVSAMSGDRVLDTVTEVVTLLRKPRYLNSLHQSRSGGGTEARFAHWYQVA